MVKFYGVQIYFVSLPGWFVAAILYVIFSAIYQRSVASQQTVPAAQQPVANNL